VDADRIVDFVGVLDGDLDDDFAALGGVRTDEVTDDDLTDGVLDGVLTDDVRDGDVLTDDVLDGDLVADDVRDSGVLADAVLFLDGDDLTDGVVLDGGDDLMEVGGDAITGVLLIGDDDMFIFVTSSGCWCTVDAVSMEVSVRLLTFDNCPLNGYESRSNNSSSS